jgi:hypothetical protein
MSCKALPITAEFLIKTVIVLEHGRALLVQQRTNRQVTILVIFNSSHAVQNHFVFSFRNNLNINFTCCFVSV